MSQPKTESFTQTLNQKFGSIHWIEKDLLDLERATDHPVWGEKIDFKTSSQYINVHLSSITK